MSFFFYTSGFCGGFHWVQNILSSRVHHVRSWSSTGMIRETLGTLRSDNGDTNENVAEKSGLMKLFPRRYTKSPIYLEVGKLGWSWREGTASEFRERWLSPRLAHKSSFWARSATVSAKRDRTSAKRERAKACESLFVPGPTTPDQKTKRTTLRKSSYHLAVPVLKSTQNLVISCRKQEIKCYKFYHFGIVRGLNLLQ